VAGPAAPDSGQRRQAGALHRPAPARGRGRGDRHRAWPGHERGRRRDRTGRAARRTERAGLRRRPGFPARPAAGRIRCRTAAARRCRIDGNPVARAGTGIITDGRKDERRMRIASWNVNSLNVRLPHLTQWLQSFAPDVVGLQETKIDDARFPDDALAALGYRSVFCGQKTYNGVAILARDRTLGEVQYGIPGFEDEQQRVIAATVGDVRIVNLYVVNGQDVGTDKYAYKLRWLDAVHAWLADELQRHPRMVVLGDF